MAADDLDRAALYAAYRAASGPSPARREQVLARLHARNARPAVLVDTSEHDRVAASARVIVLAIAAAVLAVLGLELASGGSVVRLLDDGSHEQAVDEAIVAPDDATAIEHGEVVGAVRRAQERAATIVPAEPPEPQPPLVAAVPTVVATVASAPVEPLRVPTPAAPRTANAAAETEATLMQRARAAIGRGDWAQGKAALERHAALFPDGTLSDERRALVLVVDCRIERSSAARTRARDFIVHHARSPQFERIIEACRAPRDRSIAVAGIVDPFASDDVESAD